jgi:fructose-bisphosphate aldolase class I
VPIVEPEIMADGDHDINVCAAVTERVQAACTKALQDNKILWEGCLLKPNMVTPGFGAPRATPADVAWFTVRTLRRTMPPALCGVSFLSGGFSAEEATSYLNAMNKLDAKLRPWALTFSFGRALQGETLKAWSGKDANIDAAKQVFSKVAQSNGAAQKGEYAGGALSAETNFVANYVY